MVYLSYIICASIKPGYPGFAGSAAVSRREHPPVPARGGTEKGGLILELLPDPKDRKRLLRFRTELSSSGTELSSSWTEVSGFGTELESSGIKLSGFGTELESFGIKRSSSGIEPAACFGTLPRAGGHKAAQRSILWRILRIAA
jgi:hypothetical protein